MPNSVGLLFNDLFHINFVWLRTDIIDLPTNNHSKKLKLMLCYALVCSVPLLITMLLL